MLLQPGNFAWGPLRAGTGSRRLDALLVPSGARCACCSVGMQMPQRGSQRYPAAQQLPSGQHTWPYSYGQHEYVPTGYSGVWQQLLPAGHVVWSWHSTVSFGLHVVLRSFLRKGGRSATGA